MTGSGVVIIWKILIANARYTVLEFLGETRIIIIIIIIIIICAGTPLVSHSFNFN